MSENSSQNTVSKSQKYLKNSGLDYRDPAEVVYGNDIDVGGIEHKPVFQVEHSYDDDMWNLRWDGSRINPGFDKEEDLSLALRRGVRYVLEESFSPETLLYIEGENGASAKYEDSEIQDVRSGLALGFGLDEITQKRNAFIREPYFMVLENSERRLRAEVTDDEVLYGLDGRSMVSGEDIDLLQLTLPREADREETDFEQIERELRTETSDFNRLRE